MAVRHDTCSVEGCEKIVNARGWCSRHYQEWKKKNPRKCKACGGSMEGRAPRAHYCSDSCRKCSVEGCPTKPDSHGLCLKHYRRKKQGDPMTRRCETCRDSIDHLSRAAIYCSLECRPRCVFDGCGRPRRYSNGYCGKHGSMMHRRGKPVGKFEWTDHAGEYECQACGGTFKPNGKSRKFCSTKCWGAWRRYGGPIPSLDFNCTRCGTLVERKWGPDSHHKIDRMLCDACRRARSHRHRSSPSELASRDGTDCGICGEAVDLDLRHPDPMSGSVDHIIPVALGGAVRDKENLQLSHLSCNLSKQARLDRPVQMALAI